MMKDKSIFNEKTIVDYYGLDKVKEIESKNPLAFDFLTTGAPCCVYRDIFDFTPEKEQRLRGLVGDEVFEKIKRYDKREDDCWVEVLSTSFNDFDEDDLDDTDYRQNTDYKDIK